MRIEVILIAALFIILISMQYTLNKILLELRKLRQTKEEQVFERRRDV